ncbi:hypothetical protein TNCV_851661 [Trichonephila clavipes]|nr:hypothetical protein TNCV_851661 [Trichonephila clavipes]
MVISIKLLVMQLTYLHLNVNPTPPPNQSTSREQREKSPPSTERPPPEACRSSNRKMGNEAIATDLTQISGVRFRFKMHLFAPKKGIE